MALLLEQDELNVESEMVLMNAVVNWARCEAERRGLSVNDADVRVVLKPRLLKLLRLSALSPQQFALGPGLSGWLTEQEKEQIGQVHQKVGASSLPPHVCSERTKPLILPKSEFLHFFPSNQKSGTDFILPFSRDKEEKVICIDVKGSLTLTEITLRSQNIPIEQGVLQNTRSPTYKEQIGVKIYSRRDVCMEFSYEQSTQYDSTITIKLPEPLVMASGQEIWSTFHKTGTYPTFVWPSFCRVGHVDFSLSDFNGDKNLVLCGLVCMM